MKWNTSRFIIDLTRPKVMGIVNVTPDSFSDGGEHATARSALRHCEALIRDGADILDIGGESSRPGAAPVPLQEELARVLPVLRQAVGLGVPVSVDTCKPEVMQAALELGVDIINDIWALRQAPLHRGAGSPDARQVVCQHGSCGVCLMHMHGEPQTMQTQPMSGDVVPQVLSFLEHAALSLQGLGVDKRRIVIDPGIGFGKTVEQNFALLGRQREWIGPHYPVLVGWSRKSSLARLLEEAGTEPGGHRRHPLMVASVAAAVLAIERGASIVRVHDVRETVQAIKLIHAIRSVAYKE